MQDSLQECESFDVFGVRFIPDAISMPTKFQPAERLMNFNIDPKALVKTNFAIPNSANMTARQTVEANVARIGFAQTLAQLQSRASVNSSTILNPRVPSVAVQDGDTLTGIVKNQMQAIGRPVSFNEAARLAQEVARSNGISNPDRIFPGQRLNLSVLNPQALASTGTSSASQAASAQTVLSANEATQPKALSLLNKSPLNTNHNHSVLQKTLDRAVSKGFIPAEDKQKVYDKILNMSRTYQFAPDDFARLTLMESDGMNPKATNNRCHGIIQFCDGPDRGAASAGFGSNPKAILGHSVLEQLDMVSKYFDETGLRSGGPTSLDDLYLTVLTPAARREKAPDANLNIAGSQATQLYVNRDKSAPITRNSIMQGLYQNALERLGKHDFSMVAQNTPSPVNLPVQANAVSRTQALRIGAYLNQDYVR
ncbi:MAG: LysM domain-containing protein [Betaproteobacteria bacterium]|nr:LysM domain-containing protein [Betaproteobacteria bacterium]